MELESILKAEVIIFLILSWYLWTSGVIDFNYMLKLVWAGLFASIVLQGIVWKIIDKLR